MLNIDIDQIKKTIEDCNKQLMDYIQSVGTATEIEILTRGKVRRTTLSDYIQKKQKPKPDTLIDMAEKVKAAVESKKDQNNNIQ
ncbi:hypothetical protein [Leptospira noguchii]|nr:hypothetical protein [Leptospira noguchii]